MNQLVSNIVTLSNLPFHIFFVTKTNYYAGRNADTETIGKA
jgi:hypothetical protein